MDEPIGRYFIEDDSLLASGSLDTALRPLGGSVYEVIRIIDRTPLFLEDHVGRLGRSASLAGYPFAATAARIRELVADLTNACDLSSGTVKLIYGYTGRTSKPTLLIHFIRSRYPDDEMYKGGVRVGLLRGERSSPAIKQSDTPVRKEADALLEGGGFYEILLVNGDGFITEGSRTNIFFVKDDALVTPPTHDVLSGITRQKVFEIARRGGIDLIEKAVHSSSIAGFNALFLTGTSAKILPVRSVQDLSFGTNHPLLRRLMESYDRCIESYLSGDVKHDTIKSSESFSESKKGVS